MIQFKNQTYQKHFPFLSIGEETHVDIQRLDENVLEKSFQYYSWDGSMGSSETNYKIDFVLEDGSILSDIRIGDRTGSNYAHTSQTDNPGETIAEYIDRKGIADKLKFVVVYESGHSHWGQSTDGDDDNCTIYKLPKDEKISEIVEKFRKKIEAEINAKINF